MEEQQNERELLIFNGKKLEFKYYFLDIVIVLLVLSVIEWLISLFVTKNFMWWEIPLDIVLSVVIALVAAWLRLRWHRRRMKEKAYFKEKYGKKEN